METKKESPKKRLAKNTILLYARTIITMLLGLYTSRVVLQVLGVDDFGTYNVVGGFVAMFTMISGSLTFSTQRFLNFELGKKDGKPRDVFSAAMNIHVILILVLLIVSETVGLWFINEHMNFADDRMKAVNIVFQLSVFTFALNIWSIPYSATIIAHERMDIFAYTSIFEAAAKLILIYMLKFLDVDRLIGWAVALVLVAIILRIFYSIFCSYNYQECHYKHVKDKALYKQMLSFAGWNFFATIADTLNGQGVNVISNMFFGVRVNAARGVTNQVENATRTFVNNFTTALNPQIIKAYASNDREYLNSLIIYGSKIAFFLLLIVAVPLYVEIDKILKLWLVNPPENTANFIRIDLFYLLLLSLMNAPITAMFATGKLRKSQAVTGCLLWMNFIITYIAFYLGFPAYSAYVIMSLSTFIILIYRVYILKELINFKVKRYFAGVLLPSLIVFVLSLSLPLSITYLFREETLTRLILNVIVSFIWCTILILFIGLRKDERKKLYDVVHAMISKIHR